jgi:hypothetical protein
MATVVLSVSEAELQTRYHANSRAQQRIRLKNWRNADALSNLEIEREFGINVTVKVLPLFPVCA